MALSYTEFGKKSTELIEKGRELDQQVKRCQSQIQSSMVAVAAARNGLERARQLDEDGNPVGDVSAASARLAVAQNQLLASQRALQNAQQEVEQNNQRKRAQVLEMEQHNKKSRANINRLGMLGGISFSENIDDVQQDFIARYNKIEQARVDLLESMGEKVSANIIQSPSMGASGSSWSGGGFGALDLDGQALIYKGGASSSQGGYGVSISNLIENTDNQQINQILNTPTQNSSNDNTSTLDEAINNYVEKIWCSNSDSALSRAEKIAMLQDFKNQLLNSLAEQYVYTEEEQKVLSLHNHTLSPDQLYRMGINYINKIDTIWRENLHNRGINDGNAMEKELNKLRAEHISALGKDVLNGGFSMYDIAIDFDDIANRIALNPDYKRNTDEMSYYIYSSADRQAFREKLMNGQLSEADIRAKGAKVHQMMKSYSDIVTSEFKRIEQSERELMIKLQNAKTTKEFEALEAYRKILSDERNRIYDRYGKERKDRLKNVLDRFRPMGPINNSKQSFNSKLKPNDSKVIKSINTVRKYWPSDWVEEGNSRTINVAFKSRGYYSSAKNEIALSGQRDMDACAFHEMSHRLEDMYPEIIEAEKQFYNRRTKGKALQWLGYPYNMNEKYRDGGFIHNYMGKDYGGKAYELLSMGMESAFCGTLDLDLDPEYRDFIYGILTML